ncbi:MAG: Flp family type IVb pilin [Deltaproteobacteria bacterium]|nr:Flp family type IVb pilin [Deltaproteobacteria bacterium]
MCDYASVRWPGLFARDKRGVTTIEYAILASGLAILIYSLIAEGGEFSNTINSVFKRVTELIEPDDGTGNQ